MPAKKAYASPYSRITPFDTETGDLNVVIETPKGSRNKFDYHEDLGVFVLGGILPAGAVFPFDFGFVPGTRGEDGDPLDVLVLMDEPVFGGCLVKVRLIGAVEAEQTERDGATMRNDRLIGVAASSRNHAEVHELADVSKSLVDEIEHFFVSYNEAKGKKFRPTRRADATRTRDLLEAGIKAAAKDGKR